MYRFLITTALALAGPVALTSAVAIAGDGPLPAELRDVRAAVARYHSVEHATGVALVADPVIDPLRPEVLLLRFAP